MRLRLLALLLASLTGCGNSPGPTAVASVTAASGANPDGNTPLSPASICASSSCGSKLKLLAIGDAENIQFSADGRLFVSGGTNVYEISKSGQSYSATALLDGSCNFTGMAIRANTLYVNCFNGHLYATPLAATAATQGKLADIFTSDMQAANGLVEGPGNELFAVSGPLSDQRVVRLLLDPADPMKVLGQSNWLTTQIQMPNGIQRRGNTLFIMNSNASAGEGTQILRVPILADGSAGAVSILSHLMAVGDDFSLVGEDFLAADYGTGGINLIAPDGTVAQSILVGTFASPSHVEVTRAPLFKPGYLLVTEKGIIGEPNSTYGNALTLYYPSSDTQPIP